MNNKLVIQQESTPVKQIKQREPIMEKYCVECKARKARHWDSSFCEECFKKMLQDNLKKEDESIDK